ncbi:C6 zinc finger domain protein [Penicillium chermesinum]|uniref:C6 zinc finger domain protein n=1 Tax=Penicillium chermesinum TaxID=63820 RepID=A0A9W9TJX5_9EURO|nr:C6 zinc finger domain protein [Penicillium chermesinum]KAJ5223955.1 C6 zinc finger domain protein [Penicillium chermesinum]
MSSLKSKLGCKTCKYALMSIPTWTFHPTNGCTGRKCEYEHSPQHTLARPSGPAYPLVSSPGTVWRERRAFAYYFENVALCIGGGLDVEFWRTIVPQVCGSEPAVWDAIISVSALFENPDPYPKLGVFRQGGFHGLDQPHQDALNWYSRSVSAVRQRIERGGVDVFVGLVTCTLFLCIETLQAGVEEAKQLYKQGCDLIASLRTQVARGILPPEKVSLLENTVIPLFVRLGTMGVAMSTPPMEAFLHHSDYAEAQYFTSLKTARDAMILISLEAQVLEQQHGQFVLNAPDSPLPREFFDRESSLSARLKRWNTAFTELMEALNMRGLSQQEIAVASIVMAYHETVLIILAVCNTPSHTSIDAYLPHFQNIVDNCTVGLQASLKPDGSQAPFTFEIGIAFPLWFTGLRCRDPTIRRSALALAQHGPQVQGFYRSTEMAAFGELIMMMEENYGRTINAARGQRMPEISEGANDKDQFKQPKVLLDTNRSLTKAKVAFSPSPFPVTTSMTAELPSTALIPEQARVQPIGMFRAQDGFPPGTPEQDIVKWAHRPEQPFFAICAA